MLENEQAINASPGKPEGESQISKEDRLLGWVVGVQALRDGASLKDAWNLADFVAAHLRRQGPEPPPTDKNLTTTDQQQEQ